MSSDHILVVDDDPQITSFLSRYLEKQQFKVTSTANAADMKKALEREIVDLCILDIGLPDRDGFDIIREMRAESNLPVIVLSGRDDPFDRILGLEFGADDYVTKPFEARELLARIKSVLRRCAQESQKQSDVKGSDELALVRFENFLINPMERTLIDDQNGELINLTTTEFELLLALTKHPHTVQSRDQLLDSARGRQCYVGDRTVDVHIMRLRKKIEPDSSNPIYIKTIHGIGYCFTPDVDHVDANSASLRRYKNNPIPTGPDGRPCPAIIN